MNIAGPAAAALGSLTDEQLSFIRSLPKAELHAHLNGSIPIVVLQDLAREYHQSNSTSPSIGTLSNEMIQSGINKLLDGPAIDQISDFFSLFPAIYALTSTPSSLGRAARAVLSSFLDGEHAQCTYLELRTTPREAPGMSREAYLRVVLKELSLYDKRQVGLIVSLDRRMGEEVLRESLDVSKKLKEEGERIVGVDLCGDPMAGDMALFRKYFEEARNAGLGITLHIAEVCLFIFVELAKLENGFGFQTMDNPPQETLQLLSFLPNRLGHATFLDEEAKNFVAEKNMCIEICLSSNLLSVPSPFIAMQSLLT